MTSCQRKTIIRTFIIIALIIVFFGGLYIVILGIGKINSAGNEPDMMKIKATNKPQAYESVLLAHTNHPIVNVVQLDYTTTDVFSVKNPLNYTIIANYTEPNNVDFIMALDTSADSDVSVINAQNINSTIRSYNEVGHITVLHKDVVNHIFIGSKVNYVPQSEEHLAFILFFIKNGKVDNNFLFVNQNPLIIYPPSTMFQVETDRDLRNQVVESTKTNDIVTGLTYVIIGLIPIGFVAEFFIESSIEHYFYREEKKTKGLLPKNQLNI